MVKRRSGAFILRGDEVLVVSHTKEPGKRFSHWCYPGGQPEGDEPPEETAVREIKEEVDLDVRLVKLLYELDHVLDDGPFHEYFFLASPAGKIPEDLAWDQRDPVLGGARWARIDELVGMKVLPLTVTQHFVQDFKQGWPAQPRHLGSPGTRVP